MDVYITIENVYPYVYYVYRVMGVDPLNNGESSNAPWLASPSALSQLRFPDLVSNPGPMTKQTNPRGLASSTHVKSSNKNHEKLGL